MEISIRESVPKPRPPATEKKRSATFKAASEAKEAADGDANSLLLAATQASKGLDMNRHFILKKIQKDPSLAEKIKFFIEHEIGMNIF